MSGPELRNLAKTARLKPNEVCAAADVSMPTLYKVYNERGAEQESIEKVEGAIRRLVAKARAPVAS
jgi:predicted transcriptional regulator